MMEVGIFNRIALLENKETKKLSELPKDVVVELEEYCVLLSKRVTKCIEPNIADLRTCNFVLIFKGLKGCNKPNEDAIFETNQTLFDAA